MAASLHPWVNRDLFLGFMWGGQAIATIFLCMRLAIRVKAFRRLYSDDAFVILAWVCSMAACILWQILVKGLYQQYQLSAGKLEMTPDVLKTERDLLHGTVAYLLLFFTSLYAVKASFLFFFRRLDERYDGRRKIWWWFVALITLASYLTSCGTIQWKCLLGSLEFIFTQCSQESSLKFEHSTFNYQAVMDVITDFLIISIPVIMLWNVRIPLMKKLALMSLFSLTVIVMGTTIARVSVIPTSHSQADVSWLYFWHNLELAVSLLVSSLAAFRQLYVTKSQSTSRQWRTDSSPSTATSKKTLFWNGNSLPSFVSIPKPSQRAGASIDDVTPLNAIHVSHKVGISTMPNREPMRLQESREYQV